MNRCIVCHVDPFNPPSEYCPMSEERVPVHTIRSPLPNDRVFINDAEDGYSATVIASVVYREADDELPNDRYTLLLLLGESPYYRVVTVEHDSSGFILEAGATHHNIVPAVNGEKVNEPIGLGYIEMGGDY